MLFLHQTYYPRRYWLVEVVVEDDMNHIDAVMNVEKLFRNGNKPLSSMKGAGSATYPVMQTRLIK